MVKSCVRLISSFLVDNEYISSAKYEWCCYVLEKRFVKIISFGIIFTVSSMLNILRDTIIFTFSFCLLRKYANGYHAKTFGRCLAYSLTIVVVTIKCLSPLLENYFILRIMNYVILVTTLFVHIINLDLKRIENQLFKRNVIIISLLVIISELSFNLHVACLLTSSMIFTVITIKINLFISKGEKSGY
ncbi:MAG: accessory gene regulator B family protein [Alphaproteobacteria bacterium]|nr:accessory gene regulator B family protein [Alphaproteobacteria bacterium]MBQ6849540.1 accessory gene regulator B family protein [Oscillospiraceae bacterium]